MEKTTELNPGAAGEKKPVIFSAVQPSGNLTIGNYLGAIKNWINFQDTYNSIFCVADLHAITVRQVPSELRRYTYELLALYIASGIDPEKCTLFVQSHVPMHAQLGWVLDCYTMFGELSRMTQFKDKSQKNADNINAGLFTYPSLMAADILLYGTELVPVGQDQQQHIELARDVATRFNGIYGDVFKIPEGFIPPAGAKIMSLSEPTKKMSKSDEGYGSVRLLDTRDNIMKCFKRAVTDCEARVYYDTSVEGKEGINNLMNIYSCFTGKTHAEIEKEFEGRGYGDFKLAVGEATLAVIEPIQREFARLMKEKAYLEEVMKKGAEAASAIAIKTLRKVYKKVGFIV